MQEWSSIIFKKAVQAGKKIYNFRHVIFENILLKLWKLLKI